MVFGEIREFEANRSASSDDDYDDRPAPRSHKRRSAHASKPKRSAKRRKRRGSESDIVGSSDDEDDLDSFLGDSDVSGESLPKELTATGRPRRAATKTNANLRESSEEGDVNSVNESDNDASSTKHSLIIKLAAFIDPATNMVTTRQNGRGASSSRQGSRRPSTASKGLGLRSRGSSSQPTSSRPPSRRLAARAQTNYAILEDDEEDEDELMELTNSGKGAQLAKKSNPSTRAAKRNSTTGPIIEASQEDDFNNSAAERFGATQGEGDSDEDDEDELAPSDRRNSKSKNNDDAFIADTQEEQGQSGEPMDAEAEDDEAGEEGEGDDDDEPVVKGGKRKRQAAKGKESPSKRQRRSKADDSEDDFRPDGGDDEEEDDSSSSDAAEAPKGSQNTTNGNASRKRTRRTTSFSDEEDDEIAYEVQELRPAKRTRRQNQNEIIYEPRTRRNRDGPKPDYRVFKPEALMVADDDAQEEAPSGTQSRRKGRNAGPGRTLFTVQGPFGGAPVGNESRVSDLDSDGSDDEESRRLARGITSLIPQAMNTETGSGAPATTLGMASKNQDKTAIADADPLGVDNQVSFDGVGGLDNHINQLKEMVALPLLYPEVFQQFKITPPRGVLFHGPPGTGKTLLARALASSVSSQGKKVTFYMRKGADALSKWVGEAEKQLRVLFEEARKNQPSIIFFDEIDGLAPVRSSKSEQIHASIVATLLALMDGMDGRGQVIVIGATNRPDTVDPALRRPGRFDREFYFPLPDRAGRRSILDIHTKDWQPPLESKFKDQLAELTKGYGGADLRALCTEAAINAVQGTYPQIYQSDQKLLINPSSIKVQPKDFLISINRIIPSSQRSGGSNAAPLNKTVEPLLRNSLTEISNLLEEILPTQKKLTALEEAEFDDREDAHGFEKEMLKQDFDRSRVYRPRLLISGTAGMGQQHLAQAILHKFERVHVQPFDLGTLFSDAGTTPETAVVNLFKEVRRHKPSIVYLPDVNIWYETMPTSVLRVFNGMLRSLSPNDAVLVFATMQVDTANARPDEHMLRDLFGFSGRNVYEIKRPSDAERREYFQSIITMIETPPSALPGPDDRPKRKMPVLDVAPESLAPSGPSQTELRAQKKSHRMALNLLKILIGPIMENIKKKYQRFRHGVIDDAKLDYLYEDQTNILASDLPEEQRTTVTPLRPYELREDSRGVKGLLETATGKFYYNLDIEIIEQRLQNGYYRRPRDFLADIRRLDKDAQTAGIFDRASKSSELLANVEVDISLIESQNEALMTVCEEIYSRHKAEEDAKSQKGKAPAVVHKPNSADTGTFATPARAMSSTEAAVAHGQDQAGLDLERPDLSGLQEFSGQSQLPDTQEMQHSSSQSLSDGSHRARMAAKPSTLSHTTNSLAPALILDAANLDELSQQLVRRSGGCSVEQMEQVHAALVDAVWRHRGEWNRDTVLDAVRRSFNAVITDIERMQSIISTSQSSGESAAQQAA